jgi:hypothetical protein
VRVRARARARACERVRACVRACVRVCVCVCAMLCVFVPRWMRPLPLPVFVIQRPLPLQVLLVGAPVPGQSNWQAGLHACMHASDSQHGCARAYLCARMHLSARAYVCAHILRVTDTTASANCRLSRGFVLHRSFTPFPTSDSRYSTPFPAHSCPTNHSPLTPRMQD